MLKNNIQKIFNSIGYKVEKLDNFYSNDLFFKGLLTKVKNYTMTNHERIFYLYNSINHIVNNEY